MLRAIREIVVPDLGSCTRDTSFEGGEDQKKRGENADRAERVNYLNEPRRFDVWPFLSMKSLRERERETLRTS